MDLRTGFYKHPYASIVTAVFLFSLLVTVLYYFGLVPGVRETRLGLNELLTYTGVLFVTTAAMWMAALILYILNR